MTMTNISNITFAHGTIELNLCWVIGSISEYLSDAFDREGDQFCDWFSEVTGRDVNTDLLWNESDHDYKGFARDVATEVLDVLTDTHGELFTVHSREEMPEDWNGPVTDMTVDPDGVELSRDLFMESDYIPATMVVDQVVLRELLNGEGITELDDGRTPGSGFYRTMNAPKWYVVQALTALMSKDYSSADRFFYGMQELYSEYADDHCSFGSQAEEAFNAQNA